VKGWLPEPSEVHEGMTFMLELIDPLLDPHGETEAAVDSAGMRVLAAWCNRRRLSMTELEDPSLLALLGEKATVVPQCTYDGTGRLSETFRGGGRMHEQVTTRRQ